MPLTAIDARYGLLDATLPDLGGIARWNDVHRARPPTPLTCRACAAPMSAKVSSRGLRFFAHRSAASDCPTLGETLEHRLLKIELAAAIRDAGWIAQLEVPGNGWRADVLATRLDSARRIAFEAQPAAATIDDLRERTATMAADQVEVCWVTDKGTTWVTHVPSARVHHADEDATVDRMAAADARPSLEVVAGHAVFETDWCPDRARCGESEPWGQRRAPCPGHGRWASAPALTLAQFVAGVCAGSVRLHTIVEPLWLPQSRHMGGTTIWTTRPHLVADLEQRHATAGYERWAEQQDRQRADHLARIEALLARQKALVRPTVEFVYQTVGVYPRVDDGQRSPRFAMGVPVLVAEKLTAVICPVAARITPGLAGWLATATIVVADSAEQARIEAVTRDGQRFKVIDPGPLPSPRPRSAGNDIPVHQAIARMFRSFD